MKMLDNKKMAANACNQDKAEGVEVPEDSSEGIIAVDKEGVVQDAVDTEEISNMTTKITVSKSLWTR